ncbi:hypothetical protein CYY_004396 [Polysphondylium violaceum]|uniref:MACPF domain-containing protein n=1 Tax=Polysphondylium violaceum TaxID=133409 RepID=A0A8J4PV87_9MYCE|nr:hypothetical protein CYY_004396 [Polysphondylium violaceum]
MKYLYLFIFLFVGISLGLEYKTSSLKIYNDRSLSPLSLTSTGCASLQYYVAFQGTETVDNIKCLQDGISSFTWALVKTTSSNKIYEISFDTTYQLDGPLLSISVITAAKETLYILNNSPIVCKSINSQFNINHKPIINLMDSELQMELVTDTKQFYKTDLIGFTCTVYDSLWSSTCILAQNEYSSEIFIIRVPITTDLYKKDQISVSLSFLNNIIVQFEDLTTPFSVGTATLTPTMVSYPGNSSLQNDYLTGKSGSIILSTNSKDGNTGVLLSTRGDKVISSFRTSLGSPDSKTLHSFINYDLKELEDPNIKVFYKTLEANQVVLNSTDITMNLNLPPSNMNVAADVTNDSSAKLPILKVRANDVSISNSINVVSSFGSLKVPFPFGIKKQGAQYNYASDQIYPFVLNSENSLTVDNEKCIKDTKVVIPSTSLLTEDKIAPLYSIKSKRTYGSFITYQLGITDQVSGVYNIICLNTNEEFFAMDSKVSGSITNGVFEITIDLSKLISSSSNLLLKIIDLNGNTNSFQGDSIYFDENLTFPFDLFSSKIYLKDIIDFEFNSNIFETSFKSQKNSLFFNLINGDKSFEPILKVLNNNGFRSFKGSFDQIIQKYRIDFDIPTKSSSQILHYKLVFPGSTFSFKSLQSYFGDVAIINITNTNIDNYPPMFSKITFIGGSNQTTLSSSTPVGQIGWLFTINDRPSGFKYGNVTVITNLNPKPKVYSFSLDERVSGNLLSSIYQVQFDVSASLPSQVYIISSVTLVDSNGVTSSYPPKQNQFSPFHELDGYSHSISVVTPKVVETTLPILRSFVVGQINRKITITFSTTDTGSLISTDHVPIIYLVGYQGRTQEITPTLLYTALNIYTYEATFSIDYLLAYHGCLISIYGIYDRDLNINGYSSMDLKSLGFTYYIKKQWTMEPVVDSLTSIGQNGGLLTIYGKRFASSSSKIDSKTITPIYTSANVIVYDYPPTLVQQTIKIISPESVEISVTIKPTLPVYPTNNVIYVELKSNCKTNCGSYNSPYPSLSLALKNTLKRTTIILKDGIYTGEDNMNLLIDSSSYTNIRPMNSTSKVVFDCEGYSQLFNVKGSKSFTLTNITIANCTSNRGGALFFENSIVTLDNIKFFNNRANNGGAIYLLNSELKLVNSLFKENKVITNGAAIFSDLSTLEIKGYFTTFLDNTNFGQTTAGAIGKAKDILCQSSTLKIDEDANIKDPGVKCLQGCNSLYSKRDVCQSNFDTTPPSTLNRAAKSSNNDVVVCGDKVCSPTESCLSCPNDCSCYVDGMIQQTFQPGCSPTYFVPNNPFESGTPLEPCVALLNTTLPIVKVESPSNYIGTIKNIVIRLFGYVSVESSKQVAFNFQGTNYGLIFKVNGQQQFYFNQITTFNETKSLYLVDKYVHFVEVILFTTVVDNSKRSFSLSPFEDSTTKLFYSNLVCGDGVLNERERIEETTTDNPDILNYFCVSDLDQPLFQENPACGDGICNEDPNECFRDCFIEYTPVCPATKVIEGAISPGFSVGDDTLGNLISNQFIWRLAGSEHLSFGVNIVNGEEGMAPIFQFDYCQDSATNVLEDVYRGKLYQIPVEFNAMAVPECNFDTTTNSFKSTREMASSETTKMTFEAEASFSVNAGFIKVGAAASFSDEKSISAANQISRSNAQRVFKTDLLCKSTYVELDTERVSFHPSLLDKFAKIQNSQDMLSVIETHGTHFYKKSYLGGKLTQIAVTDESNINESNENSYTESIKASLSTSISGPVYSVKAAVSSSYDRNQDSKTQTEINDKTTFSKIITYGGLPAAFSPAQDGMSSPGFGEWAQSVDILPVPIDYQLFPIHSLINEKWVNQYGVNIKKCWDEAEEIFYSTKLSRKSEKYDDIDYTLIFNTLLKNDTFHFDPLNDALILSIKYNVIGIDDPIEIEIPITSSYTDRFGNKVDTFFGNDIFNSPGPTKTSVQIGFFGVPPRRLNGYSEYKIGHPYQSVQFNPNRNMLYTIRFDFKGPDFINSAKKPVIRIVGSIPIDYTKNPKIISWKHSLGVVLDQNGVISDGSKYYGISAFESKWSDNLNSNIVEVSGSDDTNVLGLKLWGHDVKYDYLGFDETLLRVIVCYPGIHKTGCTDKLRLSFEGQDDNFSIFNKKLIMDSASYNPSEWYETTVWHSFDVPTPIKKTNKFKALHPLDNIGLGTRMNWIKVFYPQPLSWKFDVSAYHIKDNQKENHMDEWISSAIFKDSMVFELEPIEKIPKQLFFYANYNYRAPTYMCPHGWEYPYFHNIFNSTEEIGRTQFKDDTGTYTYYQDGQLGYYPVDKFFK